MDAWATFWTWLLVFGLAIFFVLAIVVSIRGFLDIRAMFSSIRARTEEDSKD